MSTSTIPAGTAACVVRTRDEGRFIRAFFDFGQAKRWTDHNSEWEVSIELTSEPDNDGYILPLVLTKENNQ